MARLQGQTEKVNFLKFVWRHRRMWLASPGDTQKVGFWTFVVEEFKDRKGSQVFETHTVVSELSVSSNGTGVESTQATASRLAYPATLIAACVLYDTPSCPLRC